MSYSMLILLVQPFGSIRADSNKVANDSTMPYSKIASKFSP